MRKLWSIVLALLALLILLILVWPAKKPTAPSAAPPAGSMEQPPTANAARIGPAPVAPASTNALPASDDFRAALRASMVGKDQPGFDAAFAGLTNYINAHPEQIDAYIAVLESEKNEHVLRAFARALGMSEVGLLDDEKMIDAILRLARDGSFEQRQHIMLNLMSHFGEMPGVAYETVVELSEKDPNSQVKTSAVALLGDWIKSFPKEADKLIQQVGETFKNASDDDVRLFSCQLLALHRAEVPRELHGLLAERLKISKNPFIADHIALALSGAPDDIRDPVFSFLESALGRETDLEPQRDRLLQLTFVDQKRVLPILERTAKGNTLLAEDAREYLSMLKEGSPKPEEFLLNKSVRDAERNPSHDKEE